MRYAQIINNAVRNVILWDGETELDLDGELINIDNTPCGRGWTYDGTTFTAPPDDDDVPPN